MYMDTRIYIYIPKNTCICEKVHGEVKWTLISKILKHTVKSHPYDSGVGMENKCMEQQRSRNCHYMYDKGKNLVGKNQLFVLTLCPMHMGEIILDSNLTLYMKINSRWVKGLFVLNHLRKSSRHDVFLLLNTSVCVS